MWYSRTVLAAIEDAIDALQSKGVSEQIIQFVHSLPDNQKGKAIGALNQNPSMMIDDLKNLFQSGYRPSSQELQLIQDYDPKFKSWALYQYKQLRANKLNDDPKDDRWEYKQSITGYAGIKDDLDKIHDFFRGHALDNPNYNLGTKSFQEAYDDSVEWHNAISQSGSGKFYLPFKRDESGNIVDEKIVHRFDDGSMMVRVEDSNDLDVEGHLMHHCVKSYAQIVKSGDCTIYSLRNKFNNPEATIEVGKDGKVKQIKGYFDSLIDDEEKVEKIKEFFEGNDEIQKTTKQSYTHNRAQEWDSNNVNWKDDPQDIKYAIQEFAYGPNFSENLDDTDSEDKFSRFGIELEKWNDDDQKEFRRKSLENVNLNNLLDKTVLVLDGAINNKSYRNYYNSYNLDDYNFEDLAENIVDIAYDQLSLMIDSAINMTDEYIAGRTDADDVERYKKSKIRQILANNPLLDLLKNFDNNYGQLEESLINPESDDDEQVQDNNDRIVDVMNESANKLRLAVARRIYNTYQANPVIKKLNYVFGVRFTIPWETLEFSNKINLRISKVQKGESRFRPQIRNITSAYKINIKFKK